MDREYGQQTEEAPPYPAQAPVLELVPAHSGLWHHRVEGHPLPVQHRPSNNYQAQMNRAAGSAKMVVNQDTDLSRESLRHRSKVAQVPTNPIL